VIDTDDGAFLEYRIYGKKPGPGARGYPSHCPKPGPGCW
jgi:hypothetical protein